MPRYIIKLVLQICKTFFSDCFDSSLSQQAHTVAYGALKKVLALEAEVKNSHAALSKKTKEANSLTAKLDKCKAELEKNNEKIKALEVNAKEFAALKDKVKEVSQVNNDFGHQL